MSEILRLTSAVWSLFHILVLFMFFFDSRYSKKKTAIITCCAIVPLLMLNFILLVMLGQDLYGKIVLPALVIPSLTFFFFMAKHRDLRFLFTFCLCDTISMEIIVLSMILNWYLTPASNIVMFVIRLAGFPFVELFAVKKLRKHYFAIQDSISKGWGIFFLVSVIFYVLILAVMAWPTHIYQRPEDMPVILVLMVLMPLMYFNIFQILFHQNKLHGIAREQELWQIQSEQMQRQLRQMTKSDERVRRERHDLRHRLSGIDMMLQKGQISEARSYISASLEALVEPTGEKYCRNAVLDAIFSYYFKLAEDKQIRVEHRLNMPDVLPVEAAELSVVLANGLENAIHACEKLEEGMRVIKCRCIGSPQFMLQISNSFDGEITLDENGIPMNAARGHGIGTRSILAFCEKNDAFVDYKIENNMFALRIVIQRQ